MRIMHLITRFIRGGAQENTLWSLRGQIREHDVCLVTGLSIGAEGNLIDDAQKCGVEIFTVPTLIRAVSPIKDFLAYRELKRIIREWRPDVVHTHSSKAGILGRIAASTENTPRIIHTIHGLPFHPYQSRLVNYAYSAAEKFAAKYCHKIVSVSKAMTAQALSAKIADAEKFVTIYSGMDVDNFLMRDHDQAKIIRQRYGFTDEHIVIGKIARLFELKGHHYLLAAFAQLVNDFPQVRLLFVGDGANAKEIKKAAAIFGDKIIFTGLLHPDEIPPIISAMDLVAHCSLREGLARVIPQAILSGKPIMAFDVDGAREIIEPLNPDWLIAPQNIAQLTQTLRNVITDLSTAKKLTLERGIKFCQHHFAWQTMNAELMKVYNTPW